MTDLRCFFFGHAWCFRKTRIWPFYRLECHRCGYVPLSEPFWTWRPQ